RILYHIVWVTRERQPLIDAMTADFLCRSIRKLAREHRSVVLEIGMVSTHIHILVRSHPLAEVPKMIGRMKGVTSRLAKLEEIAPLSWADGYDIESVSPADDLKLRHYLRAQPFRHPTEAIDGWPGDTFAQNETV
ncbi:MAG TPA: IS200/IS605 family transposase, partial [Gemmatimonadales bacterium]|nr:IS200/IS605 family transposase [Gemmatimonadales bacterium]